MQRSKPFGRAIAFMQAIAAAMSLPIMKQQIELSKLGEYQSRGKGRGGHSGKKWGARPSGKYDGVTNGRRECERRMRQMAHLAALDVRDSLAART